MATTTRVDPLKNFRFKVRFSDSTSPILGVSKVTGMKRTTEAVKHRSGGDPSTSFKLPMRTDYDQHPDFGLHAKRCRCRSVQGPHHHLRR